MTHMTDLLTFRWLHELGFHCLQFAPQALVAELTEDGGLSTCCNRNSTICESFAVSPNLTMSDPHLMLWIPVILCLLERSISLITFCSF